MPDEIRDLPEPPRDLWRIVGPGVVAAGAGVSSGEFILWPYIANVWPGWAMSAATLATYLVGGAARLIAVAALIVIGASLTLAPVVYVALERLTFVKVAAVLLLSVLAVVLAIDGESWRALLAGLLGVGGVPWELGFALLLGAIAFAGAGGGQNLCQSNWIRDKGFGMGRNMPRLVSPVTGVEEAQPAVARFTFASTDRNLEHWQRWWRFANLEQLVTFVLVSIGTICFTSMLAHSMLDGRPNLPTDVSVLRIEGAMLQSTVAPWFGVLFWAVGALSLFAASMGSPITRAGWQRTF